MIYLADLICLDWIRHTRRSFEAGETAEQLFERYQGRKPARKPLWLRLLTGPAKPHTCSRCEQP